MGYINSIGGYAMSFDMVSSGIYVEVDDSLTSTCSDMAAETNGCLCISHQVGLTLMVGVNVPSTMSC